MGIDRTHRVYFGTPGKHPAIYHTKGLLTEEKAGLLVCVIKKYFGLKAWAWDERDTIPNTELHEGPDG